MFGIAVLIGCAGTTARADDDDDALPDVKVLRSFLKALGLRRDGDGIDYRERSPLVVPPRTDLPPPQSADPAVKAAGWPDDPDVKRARQLKAERKKPKTYNLGDNVDERPLRPSELNVPAPAPRGTQPDGTPSRTAEDAQRPMSPYELGSKSVFTLKALWGEKEEYATFTGEPPRGSLIEPPPGYRTPSPNQPYGVGKEKWKPPVVDRLEPVK
jgi:hypothetical protein